MLVCVCGPTCEELKVFLWSTACVHQQVGEMWGACWDAWIHFGPDEGQSKIQMDRQANIRTDRCRDKKTANRQRRICAQHAQMSCWCCKSFGFHFQSQWFSSFPPQQRGFCLKTQTLVPFYCTAQKLRKIQMTCNEQGTKTDPTPTRHASVRVGTTQQRQKTGRGGPERESERERERCWCWAKERSGRKEREKGGGGEERMAERNHARFTFDLSKRGGLPLGARARARPLWAE